MTKLLRPFEEWSERCDRLPRPSLRSERSKLERSYSVAHGESIFPSTLVAREAHGVG
jgi:hypothetical protein